MLRVNSSNVLVVPPWECAWLSEEQYQLENSSGCVCFEVKGVRQAGTLDRADQARDQTLDCAVQGRTTPL